MQEYYGVIYAITFSFILLAFMGFLAYQGLKDDSPNLTKKNNQSP